MLMQVLALVDENFAAGVRFSIDNTYNETTNILIYNMGACHTQVCVVVVCGLRRMTGRSCERGERQRCCTPLWPLVG